MTVSIFFYILILVRVMFCCGAVVFFFNFQHLLIRLIRIEFLMLRMFIYVYLYLINIQFELIFTIIFLGFIVREGVLGLSLLISIVRITGNNYFQSLNLFKW